MVWGEMHRHKYFSYKLCDNNDEYYTQEHECNALFVCGLDFEIFNIFMSYIVGIRVSMALSV